MDHRSVMSTRSPIPQGKITTDSTSHILWHVCRRNSPAVTAILASTPSGQYEIEFAFGTVARQRVRFSSALAAIERAEDLLTELEARGYRRRRPGNRTTRPSC